MDYFNPSASALSGAHQMTTPSGHSLHSLQNPVLGLHQTPTPPPMQYPNLAHGAYAMGSDRAYMSSKHAGGLPAYPGYPGAFPAQAYPYTLPHAGFRSHGLRVGSVKNTYPAVATSAAAAAHEEYLKQAMLNAGKPPLGPYGVDMSSLQPGYYPFHSMQPTLQPYSIPEGGNKRKLETALADDGKRQKTGKQKPHKKKSKYRGVFWHSRGKAWVSSIMVNGKTTHLGYYDCEVEAARVYDKEAIRLKGITCAVNFPDSVDRFGKNKDATTATDNKRSTRHERKRAERISKYRGVCWNKCNSSWKACIKIDGRNKHIGYFSSEKDAAKAYDLKARKVRGASAKLNFPEEDKEK